MEMTAAQRLILSNQYTLMAQLDPSNEQKYQRLKTIVERGYALQISDLAKDFGDMSEALCRQLIEFMEMHHAMQTSFNLLPEQERNELDTRRLMFWGFDAAKEAHLMHYIRFLIHSEGLYPEFKNNEHDFNSQTPMYEKYQRMLKHWKDCPRKYHLSLSEITQILNR